VQTPLFWGQECKAGDLVFEVTFFRPKRTSWLIVGIRSKLLTSALRHKNPQLKNQEDYALEIAKNEKRVKGV
jgi:hypothetical protein